MTGVLLALVLGVRAEVFPPTRHLYPVLEVHDGDTLTVQTIRKAGDAPPVAGKKRAGDPCAPTPGLMAIRMLGINAPEVKGPFGKAEEKGGPEAREWLSNALGCTLAKKAGHPELSGQSCKSAVWLEFPGGGRRDRYGRTLAFVHRSPDGLLLNVEVARLGLARTYYPSGSPKLDPKRVKALDAAQVLAQKSNRGIWEAKSGP